MCSIIRNSNSLDVDPQSQEYIPTGHIQHLKSLIKGVKFIEYTLKLLK